jgi:hypothetical protein
MELALQAGSTAGCFLKDIQWRAVDVNRPVTRCVRSMRRLQRDYAPLPGD